MDRGTWVAVASGAANAGLSAGKVVVGTLSGSHALVADGVHSATDVVSSVITAIAREYGSQPADRNHPFGHGNAEAAAALAVGLLVAATGIGIAWDAYGVLASGVYSQPTWKAAAGAAVVVVVKLVLWLFTGRAARGLRSPSLAALANDHRADVLLGTALLVGVGLAATGVPVLDPVLSFAVGLVVVVGAFPPIREGFGILMDEAPAGAAEQARALAATVPGVRAVLEARVHPVGRSLVVSVVVQVDPAMPVADADAIADAVQQSILDGLEDAGEVLARVTARVSALSTINDVSGGTPP